MKQLIHFAYESRQIARLQLDVLLHASDPGQMPRPALRNYCGAVVIRFDLAAGSPQPMLIPEVRRFLRALARRWGNYSAPFFCEPNCEFLPLYFAAQLEHLQIVTYAANHRLVVRHRPQELEGMRELAQTGIRHLGLRAGMTENEIRMRQAEVSEILSKIFIHPIQRES